MSHLPSLSVRGLPAEVMSRGESASDELVRAAAREMCETLTRPIVSAAQEAARIVLGSSLVVFTVLGEGWLESALAALRLVARDALDAEYGPRRN